MTDEPLDWKGIHEDALLTSQVAALFTRLLMWALPAFGLVLAGVIYLLTRAVPGAAIFAVASLVMHGVFRLKLYRLEHQPIRLLTARVTAKDRVQSSNSTTQMWRYYVTLEVQRQRRLADDPSGEPEELPDLPPTRQYSCQALVHELVEVDDVRHFVCLGDGEIAGLLGSDGRMLRRGPAPDPPRSAPDPPRSARQ